MTVIVSSLCFDAKARPVVVSFIEFDVQAPLDADRVGGARRASRSSAPAPKVSAKSSPPAPVSNYHSRAYEQEEAERAAELADEEAVLTFLMELSLV